MLVVLLAGVGLGWSDWQQTKARETRNLQTLAASLAEGTRVMLDGARVSMVLIGRQLASAPPNSVSVAKRLLRGYLRLRPDMSAVGMSTASGHILTAGVRQRFLKDLLAEVDHPNRTVQPELNAAQRAALGQCRRSAGFCLGPPVRDMDPGSGHGAWLIPLFQPTSGADGIRLLATLLPLVDGRLPSWRGLPLPPQSVIFLLRNNGFLESQSPHPIRARYAALQDGVVAKQLMAHPELRSGVFSGVSTAVNAWRLCAVHRVMGYPLVAGVSMTHGVLVSDWWRSMKAPTAGAFALLLLSTFGYGYLRQVGREREKEQRQAQRELWEAKERAEVTLHSIGDAVITTDVRGRVLDMNAVAETLTGYARSEVMGGSLEAIFRIVQEGSQIPVDNPVRHILEKSMEVVGPMVGLAHHAVLITKDGQERGIEKSAAPIRDRQGVLLGAVLVFRDVTEKRRLTTELAYQATHDALTGLPNRALFMDRLGHDRAQTLRHEHLLVVGLLDLDGFKQVNDRFGHAAGDTLLQEMARRLRGELRSGDTLARMGGDEFGLLLPDIERVEQVEGVCARLLEVLSTPFRVAGEDVPLSGSVGLTSYPLDDAPAEDLLRHADLALYAAKAAGKDRFQWFEWPMDQRQKDRMEVYKMAEAALNQGRLLLHYQPVVEIASGPVAVEALLRLNHPERGLLSPAAFASALDAPRLARRIGRFVLESALAQAETWYRQNLPLCVTVNVSAYHLLDQAFLSDLRIALDAHADLPASAVEIEITETAPLQDFEKARETLLACNQMGVRIALDDFGTGNASLTYLQKLPAQTIKIDQSFVRNILHDPKDHAIVAGVVTSAHLLGLQVVAEGVETDRHVALLTQLQCHCLQGYAIARPMAPEWIPDWVKQYKPMIYNDNYHPPALYNSRS